MWEAGYGLAQLYKRLHAASVDPDWRPKPKLHLMLHLCDSRHEAAKTWSYRDEDFAGTIAAMAKNVGGIQTPAAFGGRILVAFFAQPVPVWKEARV